MSPLHDPKHKAVVQAPVAPLGVTNRKCHFEMKGVLLLTQCAIYSQSHHSRTICRPRNGPDVCEPWTRTEGFVGKEVCKGKVSERFWDCRLGGGTRMTS